MHEHNESASKYGSMHAHESARTHGEMHAHTESAGIDGIMHEQTGRQGGRPPQAHLGSMHETTCCCLPKR